jgi:hypothetical protein
MSSLRDFTPETKSLRSIIVSASQARPPFSRRNVQVESVFHCKRDGDRMRWRSAENTMLLLAFPCASMALVEDGRVEVEGFVIKAVAKPVRPLENQSYGEYDLELTVSPKAGGDVPPFHFAEAIRVLDENGKVRGFDTDVGVTRSGPRNCRIRRIATPKAHLKALPGIEGKLEVIPVQWKSVVFEGASLQPNAVVAIEGGNAKLTVLHLKSEQPEARIRLTTTQQFEASADFRVRATVIDAKGGETMLLRDSVERIFPSRATTERIYCFRALGPLGASAPKRLLLEIPMKEGRPRSFHFRIAGVPVEPFMEKGKVDR